MTHAEFTAWLDTEVDGNRMSSAQRQDLLTQKALFDSERAMIQNEYPDQIVGYISEQRRSGYEIHQLLDSVDKEFPGRMIYFEPIRFSLA
jgi:hypothetical protein